jgi:hypothetical protein
MHSYPMSKMCHKSNVPGIDGDWIESLTRSAPGGRLGKATIMKYLESSPRQAAELHDFFSERLGELEHCEHHSGH